MLAANVHSEPVVAHYGQYYIDGLVQDYSNSSVLAMELLQSCAKPSIYAEWLKPPRHQSQSITWWLVITDERG